MVIPNVTQDEWIDPAWGNAVADRLNNDLSPTVLDGRYAPLAALHLPGVAGTYVSTPADASLDITADITLAVRAKFDTTSGTNSLLSKKASSTTASYQFMVINDQLYLVFPPDGLDANQRVFASTANLNGPVGVLSVATTLDADNGAGQATARFFTSVDGVTWTKLGADVTQAGVASIFASTSRVEIGSTWVGAATLAQMSVMRATVANGIGPGGVPGGTVVADWRSDIPADRYRDSTGKVWTVNGSAWSWMVA